MNVTPGIRAAILDFVESEIHKEITASRVSLEHTIEDLPTPTDVLENSVARKLAVRAYEKLFDPKTIRDEVFIRSSAYCRAYQALPVPDVGLPNKPWAGAAGSYDKSYESTAFDKIEKRLEFYDRSMTRERDAKLAEYAKACGAQFSKFLVSVSHEYHQDLLKLAQQNERSS